MHEQIKSPRITAALNLLLSGKTFRPTDDIDRRSVAHVVSQLRNDFYVPIETIELVPAPNKVIGYRMTEGERADYFDNRAAQVQRVKNAIERTKAIRSARDVVEFFARQGKAQDVPEWCARLAQEKYETEEKAA